MEQHELIPGLFRTEYRKIASVLCKHLGVEHIETAEDIVSETFLSALETWPYKGFPQNPVAWLYKVAKNKTLNYINRNHLFTGTIAPEIQTINQEMVAAEPDLSAENIYDSQLQMLFAICHPAIPVESQVGLALRLLCGFGIEEIADALLTNKETINKRLLRAKEKLREEKVKIEMPSEQEIDNRLDAVLMTIYLLFNEGYYSESNDEVIRKDLCLEAMRLVYMLTENRTTDNPVVNALLALICFHSSRLEARKNSSGEIILYAEQDESLWNRELITRGAYHLNIASKGEEISRYHLEAGIAYWHTIKTDTPEKWENILALYNQLLIRTYSPVAALNRAFAVSKVKGKLAAIEEAEKLNLTNNHFYFTLLGELYRDTDIEMAIKYYRKALSLAKTKTDRSVISKNIITLESSSQKSSLHSHQKRK
jgi:RNA polymerase sigma factor (sigma-70 family)